MVEVLNNIHTIYNNDPVSSNDLCTNLCYDIIAKYPNLIFESTEFTSESALISVLNRDDLQMKESEIWDYLIKWGTSRNPTLLEKLEECSDVIDKIKPYKKILDKQLWNNLKHHLLLPDRPIKYKILPPRLMLTQELPARISSWSDSRQISYSLTNNPYELQLILRGNKDGFAPITFWIFVITIVVTKVKRKKRNYWWDTEILFSTLSYLNITQILSRTHVKSCNWQQLIQTGSSLMQLKCLETFSPLFPETITRKGREM
ncbi:hypothetical protein Glove_256g74 [Diversispora epigaea]|uniref:BACK domain-containing protein n=1 Tax=Diversispora epigaea TaxID=1348612 RepID=A0A397I743_9GLOM|nr:hypothetical protein Glove_256g74 [Diversispora epigaea]